MANFVVNQTTDNGLGTVAGTLSWAIRQANVAAGDDTITLGTNVNINGVMKTLINSNIQINGQGFTVNGDSANDANQEGDFRPFFVLSGTVVFNNLTVTNGLAQGGGSGLGGGGAGLGGGLFIYGGAVTLNGVTFSNNRAIGGTTNEVFLGGGGGMYGSSLQGGGGGLFANGTQNGGYGGNGYYGGFSGNLGSFPLNGGAGGFGGGGGYGYGSNGGTGGFGGGGGYGYYNGGAGGFGGGGGYSGGNQGNGGGDGGAGGFGGGGGGSEYGSSGLAGSYGGNGVGVFGGAGAGLGGAVFIRSGSLQIINSSFTNNTATGGIVVGAQAQDGSGLGGAIFALSSTTNASGNNQGMPTVLPTVAITSATFSGNDAASADGNTGENGVGPGQNNNDIFGSIVGTLPPATDGPIIFNYEQFVRYQLLDEGIAPRYSETLYLLANPDIQAAVQSGALSSGFQHFTQFGQAEGRSVVPLNLEVGGIRLSAIFDETYYLSQYADIANAVNQGAFTSGFEHFLLAGLAEGRNPSDYYNEAFYLQNNQDVQGAVGAGRPFSSGLVHYLLFGHEEDRAASEFVDPNDYLLNNPDVAAAVQADVFRSGFEHLVEFGANEGRVSLLLFSAGEYLQQNPDVAAALGGSGLALSFDHYISFGQREQRNPSSLFDESDYRAANPDVAGVISAGGLSSGMEHYFRFGRAEGRALA